MVAFGGVSPKYPTRARYLLKGRIRNRLWSGCSCDILHASIANMDATCGPYLTAESWMAHAVWWHASHHKRKPYEIITKHLQEDAMPDQVLPLRSYVCRARGFGCAPGQNMEERMMVACKEGRLGDYVDLSIGKKLRSQAGSAKELR